MYWPDIMELRQFYATGHGKLAGRILWARVKHFWPELKDASVLGLGYAVPLIRPLRRHNRVVAAMPAAQGVIRWPRQGANQALMVDELALPFADKEFDHVLVAHLLEHSHAPQVLMQEIWRVLAPGGSVVVVAPNRQGIWARLDTSPFGSGSPYSAGQLRQLLQDAQFSIGRSERALFFPPTESKLLLRAMPMLERIGSSLLPMCGGVLMMEGVKEVYAIRGKPQRVRAEKPVMVPGTQPALGRG